VLSGHRKFTHAYCAGSIFSKPVDLEVLDRASESQMNDIRELLRTTDTFAAIEHVQRDGTPLEIAARYQSLVGDLYWKAHDLPAVVAIGHGGINYCLSQSLVAGTPAEATQKLRSTAKALAYNIGSFTWPGWEEPGIHPGPADLAAGRDCAKLNLRLAVELAKPPDRVSMAHWLVGAHALAAADFDNAVAEFRTAQDVLPATDPACQRLEPCNMGYLSIAQLCKNPDDSEASARLDEVVGRLKARSDEDASEYLKQLETARRCFMPAVARR
jgi:hypothetical protein